MFQKEGADNAIGPLVSGDHNYGEVPNDNDEQRLIVDGTLRTSARKKGIINGNLGQIMAISSTGCTRG